MVEGAGKKIMFADISDNLPQLSVFISIFQSSSALTGVAPLVMHPPPKSRVSGSFPGQGPCLGFGFCPWSVCVREATDRYFSLTSMFFPLSFFLLSPLSKNKINKIFFFFIFYQLLFLWCYISSLSFSHYNIILQHVIYFHVLFKS